MHLSAYCVTWVFEYLLHELDLEILKEMMPQRKHKFCVMWFEKTKTISGLWNHMRDYEEGVFEMALEE